MAKKIAKGINPPVTKERKTRVGTTGGNKTKKGQIFGKWQRAVKIRNVKSA